MIIGKNELPVANDSGFEPDSPGYQEPSEHERESTPASGQEDDLVQRNEETEQTERYFRWDGNLKSSVGRAFQSARLFHDLGQTPEARAHIRACLTDSRVLEQWKDARQVLLEIMEKISQDPKFTKLVQEVLDELKIELGDEEPEVE